MYIVKQLIYLCLLRTTIEFCYNNKFNYRANLLQSTKDPKRVKKAGSFSLIEDVITSKKWIDQNFTALERKDNDKLTFPELSQAGIDEKALRESVIGKIIFGVIDVIFPVFKEPNWFDIYGTHLILLKL